MKKILATALLAVALLIAPGSQAQFVVSDPMHTGVTTLIKMITDPSFKTMVKSIEELKKVSSSVRQFKRGIEVVETISRSAQKMAQLSAAASRDGHIYPAEFELMTTDIQAMAAAGTGILTEMKSATTQSGGILKMSDAERVAFIEKAYVKTSQYERMIDGYFRLIRARSVKRSGNKADYASTARLYTVAGRVDLGGSRGSVQTRINGSGYDNGYVDDSSSVLDKAYTSEEARQMRLRMQECNDNQRNYYDELQLAEAKMEHEGLLALLKEGYSFQFKPARISDTFSSVFNFIDSGGATTDGKAQGTGTTDVRSQIEEGIKNFVGPDGAVISNEEMMVLIRIKARELVRPVREELRTKWKIDDCLTLGYK